MIPTDGLVELSRWQFALTAMYHFLFVPLTLGLSWILFIMESVYVMTGKVIYRDMTRFWGKLFAINFALGVTTGLTMEFQFGTNWSYYSHYVGDIFGAPLAIEGLMAFFLESTFVGLFFFGWDKLSKRAHLVTTFMVALGSNLSALWILVANGWMNNPAGSHFNVDTMRMELTSFGELFFNPVAQVKFVHTVGAGYVTATMFVLAISAYYLLRGRGPGVCPPVVCGGLGFRAGFHPVGHRPGGSKRIRDRTGAEGQTGGHGGPLGDGHGPQSIDPSGVSRSGKAENRCGHRAALGGGASHHPFHRHPGAGHQAARGGK